MLLRRLMAIAVGIAAGFLGGELCWLVVQRVWPWQGGPLVAGPAMVFVVVAGVIAGVLGLFFAWRAIVGAPIEHAEWMLELPSSAAGLMESHYRLSRDGRDGPRVGDLLTALHKLGYRIVAATVDDAARANGPAKLEAPLAGASLQFVDPNLGEPGGRVIVRVPRLREDGVESLGFLDSWGWLDGPHEELSQFVVVALGDLVPGLAFKRLSSALESEPATSLRGELPARPRFVSAR